MARVMCLLGDWRAFTPCSLTAKDFHFRDLLCQHLFSPIFFSFLFFLQVVPSLNYTDVISVLPLEFLPGNSQLLYTQELLQECYLWSNISEI